MEIALKQQDITTVLRLCKKHSNDKRWENRLKIILTNIKIPKSVPIKRRQKIKAKAVYAKAKEFKLKNIYRIREDMLDIEDDPIRTVNFATYAKMLSKAGKSYLLSEWQIFDRMFDFNSLKELGSYMKSKGPDATKDWFYMVNIEALWGWREIKDGPKIWDKVLNWVHKKFIPQYKGSEDLFNKKFREKIRTILRWRPDTVQAPYTLREFVQLPPVMGTAGSSFDRVNTRKMNLVDNDSVPIEFNKNKFSKTFAYSEDERYEMMKTQRSNDCNVSIKMELYPKVRTIVSMNYLGAEQMRYLDTWLKKYMKGNPISTLWLTKKQRLDMWIKFAENETNMVNCPIDQSAFDAHCSKMMIQIVNEELEAIIREKLPQNEAKDDLSLIANNITEALKTGTVFYNYTDEDGKRINNSCSYENGVLSGWGFTAFYDTIINAAEMEMAFDRLLEEEISFKKIYANVQGDDQYLTLDSWNSCLAYWAAMYDMNLDINLDKNFFSTNHNEYLRKWSTQGIVNGYPARIINKMCWLYPGSAFVKEPLDRMRNICDNWLRLSERFMIPKERVIPYIMEDIGGAKLDVELCKKLLYAKVTVGGIGLLPHNDYVFNRIGGEWIIDPTIVAKGYEDFKLRYGEYQVRELEAWSLQAIGAKDRNKKGKELKKEVEIILGDEPIKPKEFLCIRGVRLLDIPRIKNYPDQVIFGNSDELIEKIFPTVQSFIDSGNAPKSWCKDYLTGKLDMVTPPVQGLSVEMASLVWSEYSGSLSYAMYQQRRTQDKWRRLNYWAETNFDKIVQNNHKLPIMIG